MVFPLQQKVMSKQVAAGVVFIGNAAHTLHPVAGQGFNLGLRDVAMLVQMISQYGLENLSQLSEQYQRARQQDQNATAHFTDLLVRLFTHPHPGVALVRQIGLIALDNSPALKRLLSRYASGLAGVVPDLVCGLPLQVQP
jgi:2-octaprenyl-6-methoxyphenol hydroxylase